MGIKRVTIDYDDSTDKRGDTHVPPSLTGQDIEKNLPASTGLPSYEEAEETDQQGGASPISVITGRTYSDLMVESKDDPRVVLVVLYFISFLSYVAFINNVSDLVIPAIVGTFLNALWFGVGWIKKPETKKK